MRENKILILGGKGLVGSSLTKHFKDINKYEVISTSRLDADLFNKEETQELISTISPNIIINAAAKVGGIHANNTNRTSFIIDNLKINLNVLESCIKYPAIKIINLGSSCIYPLNAENPIKEEEIMTGKLEPTNSPYAMAKLSAIEIGNAMKIEFGHNIINLMPTNLYGPRDNFSEDESHVIPGLISRMHKSKMVGEEQFKIWGSGKPLREFLYVDDLSKSIEFILSNNITDNLLNVGSGEEVSIMNLAELVADTINYDGNLIFDSTKPDGNPRKKIDSSKLNNYGWESSINLKDGLKATYDWYLENF